MMENVFHSENCFTEVFYAGAKGSFHCWVNVHEVRIEMFQVKAENISYLFATQFSCLLLLTQLL